MSERLEEGQAAAALLLYELEKMSPDHGPGDAAPTVLMLLTKKGDDAPILDGQAVAPSLMAPPPTPGQRLEPKAGSA